MVQVIYDAAWFYTSGLLFDLLAALVLSLLSITALQFLNISKERRYKLLSGAFGVIAVSFFAKTIFEWLLHEVISEGETHLLLLNDANISLSLLSSLYAYRILLVIGLYLLYAVYENQSSKTILLVCTLLATLVIASKEVHYVFHGITFILFFFITISVATRPGKKSLAPNIITGSFIALTANRLFLTFASFSPPLYIIAMIIQLLAFVAILGAFIYIHYATPTLKTRYNK